jgi:hypothetical protein
MREKTFTRDEMSEIKEIASDEYYNTKNTNYRTFERGNTTYLISYASVVMSINVFRKEIVFFPLHDYSNTTSKHVCAFIDSELGTRIYAKERKQAIKEGSILLYDSEVKYTVYYCDYQPKVSW